MAPEVLEKVGFFQLVSGHSQTRPRPVLGRKTHSPTPNLLKVPPAHRLEERDLPISPDQLNPKSSDRPENFRRHSLFDRSTLAQQTLVRRTEFKSSLLQETRLFHPPIDSGWDSFRPQNPTRQPVFMDSIFNTPIRANYDLLDTSDPNLNQAVDPSFTDLAHRSPVSCILGSTSTQSPIPTTSLSDSMAPSSSHYIAHKTAEIMDKSKAICTPQSTTPGMPDSTTCTYAILL